MSSSGDNELNPWDAGNARAASVDLYNRRLLTAGLWLVSAVVCTLCFSPSHTRQAVSGVIAIGADPNTAAWWELAALPEIGEATAKAIVDYRSRVAVELSTTARQGDASEASNLAFRAPSDLDRVPGIGPKTVQRIARHLRFAERD
jgi:hypothetical protein